MDQDGATDEARTNPENVTATTAMAEDDVAANATMMDEEDTEEFPLCDRLVEESGILAADEIRLEEVKRYRRFFSFFFLCVRLQCTVE